MKPNWTDEWPTEEGLWWLYGWTSKPILFHGEKPPPPELILVSVWKASNAVMHVAGGQVLYPSEGAKGKWLKATLPELPSIEKGEP